MSSENAVRSDINSCIISSKANVCPFTVRLAWHASGTYDKHDKTEKNGGSNGATMRFDPEINHGANAGLSMMQQILKPVKEKYPELSYADLWTLAGVQSIKLMGGPNIPFNFGRSDDEDSSKCPVDGRLPDASLGSSHLREVFYRMGFNDRDIVALSGGHTIGSCHEKRSGYDGPWTSNTVKFDNEYFINLRDKTWEPRDWDGPLQYTDPSGKLMMLPTDIALTKDKSFNKFVRLYASNEMKFFQDFAEAFGKLIALGCPAHCQPGASPIESGESKEDQNFRDLSMHGNLIRMKEIAGDPNPNSKEKFTNRTPLHKACYFGHDHVIKYLLELGADLDPIDAEGDTPLHDACWIGHTACVKLLLDAGAAVDLKNAKGETAADLASLSEIGEVIDLISASSLSKSHRDCSIQ